MDTKTIRKSTSFRLRTDVLEILKKKAVLANRTLNNYVESLLIKGAYSDDHKRICQLREQGKAVKVLYPLSASGYSGLTSSLASFCVNILGQEGFWK
ncbi:MAG: hypothetical protein LKH27_00040 [Prevotella sp.]|jgi:hypothetical protein|nr:hypothetical protein [Prevotella sp.]MCH3992840.1 hypothetical protein [Prevotella sp.]MCH4099419.1 hypothetical protein [Prevotella sp.]MCI1472782.1 hypothetical protein [Prevotella sp.]MCI1517961.1 hypothetical protein [Prevotella sp.]MCI1548543.1 hypothetical protein [Prevotella sp.]